jgi:predicted ATPase with chaperone activity
MPGEEPLGRRGVVFPNEVLNSKGHILKVLRQPLA